MIKIQSTIIPKERLVIPYSRPSMSDILDYWSKEGSKIDEQLYLKILKTKKYGVLV